MSRAYREMIEKQHPALLLYADGDERCARLGEQEWLADNAAQLEWDSWMFTLEEQQQ